MTEEPAEVNDSPSLPMPASLLWKLTRPVMRFLGELTRAMVASLGAALILLLGVKVVLGFGILTLLFVIALFITAFKLALLFLASTVVSSVVLIAILHALAFAASRRAVVVGRWRLRRIQRPVRMAVRGILVFSRTKSRTELVAVFCGIILIMAAVLMMVFLMIRGAEPWKATWRSVRLPALAPVGRVGRSETRSQVSQVGDIANYINARHDKVAAKVTAMAQLALARGDHSLISGCGNALPLHPAEAAVIAELYVDLTQAPPIAKREYILNEEQLTAALSLLLVTRSGDAVVDCVKLHRNYMRFFTTTVDTDGAKKNYALGMSVVKDGGGSLSMVLDEVSIGRASFQVGWLGLGIREARDDFGDDADGTESSENFLRIFDSRVFSINVFEGYVRIVTWRLPSVLAARAAIDVGYTQQAVENRVEPRDDAASLGMVRPGDLVYVLERTDEWLYVCSEVSGHFGWLPKAAFTSLESSGPKSGLAKVSSAPSSHVADSSESRLQKLNNIYKKRLITKDEYVKKRAEILKSM